MKKIISFVAAGAFTLFMGTAMASAASITNPLFSNGDTSIDATGGSTVNGTFTLTVGSNEVCEVVRTWDDSQPFVDTSVGGELGYQEGVYTNVPFTVKVGPNTTTVNAYAQCAGIYGGIRSISGADNVVAGPTNLGTIRVVAVDNSSGSTTVGSTDAMSQILAALTAILGKLSATPAPAPTPVAGPACAQLSSYVFFGFGDKGQGVKSAQSFVMANGGSISAGATGFWGNQSIAALGQANLANHCQ